MPKNKNKRKSQQQQNRGQHKPPTQGNQLLIGRKIELEVRNESGEPEKGGKDKPNICLHLQPGIITNHILVFEPTAGHDVFKSLDPDQFVEYKESHVVPEAANQPQDISEASDTSNNSGSEDTAHILFTKGGNEKGDDEEEDGEECECEDEELSSEYSKNISNQPNNIQHGDEEGPAGASVGVQVDAFCRYNHHTPLDTSQITSDNMSDKESMHSSSLFGGGQPLILTPCTRNFEDSDERIKNPKGAQAVGVEADALRRALSKQDTELAEKEEECTRLKEKIAFLETAIMVDGTRGNRPIATDIVMLRETLKHFVLHKERRVDLLPVLSGLLELSPKEVAELGAELRQTKPSGLMSRFRK